MTSNTEVSHRLGISNVIVDCVATGESFRREGILPIGTPILGDSTAHLYLESDSGIRDDDLPMKVIIEHSEDYLSQSSKEELHKKVEVVANRLSAAAKEYAKLYPDSIWHPQGRTEEAR